MRTLTGQFRLYLVGIHLYILQYFSDKTFLDYGMHNMLWQCESSELSQILSKMLSGISINLYLLHGSYADVLGFKNAVDTRMRGYSYNYKAWHYLNPL